MSNTILKGSISFVNHDKHYVMIEYEANGKKKTINGYVDEKTQQLLIKKGVNKKLHVFHIGDVINFTASLSEKGDKLVAVNIQYLYNPALDVLLNKAKTENSFIGYLKMAGDKLFVKEIDSYLFFPVADSPWRIQPTEQELNEAVTFSLENITNKEKVTAKLFNNNYIPEFYSAVKLYKSKTPVEAEVYKVSPHGIYLNIIGNKILAKIPVSKKGSIIKSEKEIKAGDKLNVLITYLTPQKIIVEEVD